MSGIGYQAIRVGREGPVSTLDNALSEIRSFGLKLPEAKAIVQDIAQIVDGWRHHFEDCAVKQSDLETLGQYLDNDRLGAQRRAHVGAPVTVAVVRHDSPPEEPPENPPRG